MNVGDRFTKDGTIYVVTIIDVSEIAMRVYMRSENDMLAEIERNNKLLQRPTKRAVDEGDLSAPEGDTSPEVLSAGEAGSTPALHH